MTLILASSSPYRRSLLERLRLPFDVQAPDADETALLAETSAELARRLALAKATAVASSNPDAVVIGSDQVPSLDGVSLGKPGSPKAAFEQLSACSGHRVDFYTGLAVIAPGRDALVTCETTSVYFRELTAAEIRRYLELDEPFDCAGSFKWESLGIALFERLEGEDPTALEGLPLIALCRMLREVGLDPLEAGGQQQAQQ